MPQRTPFLVALSLAALTACGPQNSMGGYSKHTVTNMPPLDLRACFPEENRELGDDATLEAMWLNLYDVEPRINECRNDLAFRSGGVDSSMRIELVVQPDHSVKVNLHSDLKDAKFNGCVKEALALVKLPTSSEPSGQTYTNTWSLEIDQSDELTVDGSILGTLIGTIRTRALDTCGCLEPFKDALPPNIKFKFRLDPTTPYPQNVELASKNIDPALAECLQKHIAETTIRKFDQELFATYKFKFSNSRIVNLDQLLTRAAEAANKKQHEEALVSYKKALTIEASNFTAMSGVCNALFELARYEDAYTACQKGADTQDESKGGFLYDMGRIRAQQKRYEEAIELYEDALDEADSFHAYHAMSNAQFALGQYDDAAQSAERSRALNPKYAHAYLAEARGRNKLGEVKRAIELLEAAKRLDEWDDSAWNALVVVYLELGNYDDALKSAEAALAADMGSATLHYNRGIALQNLDRREEATAAFCEAAKIEPDNTDLRAACEGS